MSAIKQKASNYPAISIRGASLHNLQHLDVDIPYDTLSIITGPSGAGKTALGFKTLLAEGCRRYIESFSAHARQFLEKIPKPPVESMCGVLPSIGLRRKGAADNPRARVGTTTDLYDYIKLLYARVGITYSPISGVAVKKHTIEDVLTYITACDAKDKIRLLAPLTISKGRTWQQTLQIERGKGFVRLYYAGKVAFIEALLKEKTTKPKGPIYLVIDRFRGNPSSSVKKQLADSIKTAFFEGKGQCVVEVVDKDMQVFSDRFEADGMTFETPSLHFFSFNSSYGSCKECNGIGKQVGVDPAKVIPDPTLSIREDAILPWKNPMMSSWKKRLVKHLKKLEIQVHTPYAELTTEEKQKLWKGSGNYVGIEGFFTWLDTQAYRDQYRIFRARYLSNMSCPVCRGSGLRKEVDYIRIGGKSIIDLLLAPIDDLYAFFTNLLLPAHQAKIGKILLSEITNRLFYLKKVGLGYLTLHRKTKTLSGGEYQRARLAKILGSPLVNNLYVLDEPTAGLHQRDAANMVEALIALKDTGNTVVVVGHEELVMHAADRIIDLGPEGGKNGGKLLFQGQWENLLHAKNSPTAAYLTGKRSIPVPQKRRAWQKSIRLEGISKNNLHNLDVTLPLEIFTIVSGVSGSGKSTLVHDVLYPAFREHLYISNTMSTGNDNRVSGNIDSVYDVRYMEQDPLNKSARSSLASYLDFYRNIRNIFAAEPLARERFYDSGHFSFNSPYGRCEECEGEGKIKVDMQFMEDIYLTCEACAGKRFQDGVLEVRFQGKNIIDILHMSVAEALDFFATYPHIRHRLDALMKLGLGYLTLGQTSNTFSTGEAQRVKLASFLSADQDLPPTLFIFDEPSSGLHFQDIQKLIVALNTLVDRGHTVLAIEHNMEMIKCADWVLDLGPEGGIHGGQLVFAGTPEKLLQEKHNHTARFLRKKMRRKGTNSQ